MVIQQGSGGYTTRIRRLYNKDQVVIQQASGGYVSNEIIEPLHKILAYKGCKITAQKKFFFVNFALLAGFFWYWCYYLHWSRGSLSSVCEIFKASALWADAFYKSKCPCVCPSVCPSVRLSVCSLLRYRLTVFLPPLPVVGCQIFLEIRNPWGKVMKRSGLRF